MTQVTVAEAIVQCLLAEDISVVFNLSGTQILPILDAVDRCKGMRSVLARHEQGAGLMAMGYANASRKPSVCLATAGPGAVNMMAGIAAAQKSRMPVIAITGLHDRWLYERDMQGDVGQVALYAPITKWSQMATTAAKVPELLRRAFRIATSGVPGPVHLAIPRDVQNEVIDFVAMEPWQYRSTPRTDCDLSQLKRVVGLLADARFPVILAGPEVVDEGASAELISLAEALGIPVAATAETDAMPYRHPLAVGCIGRDGSKLANSTVRQADVLLAIGTDFDWHSTQYRHSVIPEGARIVHVTRFGEFVGSRFPATVVVEGSPRCFLRALRDEAQAGRLRPRDTEIASGKQEWDRARRAAVDSQSVPIRGAYLASALRDALPDDAILVTDVGYFNRYIRRHFDFFQPNTYFQPREYGGIGVGLPYAIGVKLAQPNRDVILAAGDGGFMLNVGELETAVREGISVTAVVFNDRGLGSERAHIRHDYGDRSFDTEYGDVNFAQMAEAMGARGVRVSDPADIPGVLRDALRETRATVVDVVTDQELEAGLSAASSLGNPKHE